MRLLLLVSCLALLGHFQPGYAFSDEDFNAFGRYFLFRKNLPVALSMFSYSSDAEGKTLKALTSLALLQRDSGTVTFFNNLYIDSPANIWEARDVGYHPNRSTPIPYRVQNNPNANQLAFILRNVHLPAYLQADTDLSAFTSDSLLVPLGRSETGYPDINLDRGDVLMIRALLACGRGVAYLINAHNTSMLANEFLLLREEPGPVTIENFLAKFADVGKLANPNDLPLARQEFKNSITLYKQASEWIRTQRTANAVRLFNLPGSLGVKSGEAYTASLENEAKFRTKLDEYAMLLDGSRLITGFDNKPIDTFSGKLFFDGSINLRSILPSFRKNKIRQGNVTDAFAKGGGIYPANTITKTEVFLLRETQEALLDPYAFGLFVPPQLSITSPTGGSVSESYQPAYSFIALGYSWGYYDDDGLGLYLINPQTGDFSKLNSYPIGSLNENAQESWVSGPFMYFRATDWSTWPSKSYLHEISLANGSPTRTICLSDLLPGGNVYVNKILDGISDFIVIVYSYSDWKDHIYNIDKATLVPRELDLGSNALSYFYWNTWTLDQNKESIWLAGWNNNGGGYIYNKYSLSSGELLQTVPLGWGWWSYPNFQSVVAGKNSFIALKWGNWPIMSLVEISYSNGEERVLNPDLFNGRQYDWNSGITLDSTGESLFTRSVDSDWNNRMIHVFSVASGQLLDSFPIGRPGKDLFPLGMSPIPGPFAYANRTGDVSEPITISLSLSGTASNGLDYTFPTAFISLVPGNTQQPLPFQLINDTVLEFDETVVMAGTPDPESESTFQPFTLTVLDDDGSGVGIVATDSNGKEGRMNPDPFGFRFGVYDPIRFEIRRSGSTALPISVKVSRDALLSSASPDDYEITGFDVDGQSVRIPAGKSSAEIVVSPKFDINYPESTESLTLKINPDPNYNLIEPSSATGSIADSSPYVWWAYQMGILVANQSPTMDTDKDGLPNLLEMALGLDPNLPDSQNSIKEGLDTDGYLTLTYKRWSGGTVGSDGSYNMYGVTYRPQGSSSLELPNWSTSPIQVRSITDTGDGMEEVVVRDTQSKSQPKRFMRLIITL